MARLRPLIAALVAKRFPLGSTWRVWWGENRTHYAGKVTVLSDTAGASFVSVRYKDGETVKYSASDLLGLTADGYYTEESDDYLDGPAW